MVRWQDFGAVCTLEYLAHIGFCALIAAVAFGRKAAFCMEVVRGAWLMKISRRGAYAYELRRPHGYGMPFLGFKESLHKSQLYLNLW